MLLPTAPGWSGKMHLLGLVNQVSKYMPGHPKQVCAAITHGTGSCLLTWCRLAAATRGEALASLAGLSGGGGGGTPRAAEQGSGLAGLSGLGAEGIASLAAATATEVGLE